MAAILELCRLAGAWLISDEVYGRLVYEGEAAASALDVATPDDRVMVIGSFSKTWAMTGWRVGWLVVPDGVRDRITELVEITHSGVAPFVQAGALAALTDDAFSADFRAYCAQGRALTAQALAGIPGLRYASPPGAFYAFVAVDGLTDSLAAAMRLVTDHKVAVAPGSAFGAGGEGYLRLCFAQSAERLQRALGRLADGLKSGQGSALDPLGPGGPKPHYLVRAYRGGHTRGSFNACGPLYEHGLNKRGSGASRPQRGPGAEPLAFLD
jgi:aspartate/methionine/tyrosine aminotransferase